jgi:hypothetical protein
MKKTYIIYRVTAQQVLLFLNQKRLWTGYITDTLPFEVIEVGVLNIFEGVDSDIPTEEMIFCRVHSDEPFVKNSKYLLDGPTFFPVTMPLPLEEMGAVQKEIIGRVLESCNFTGTVRFKDRKRPNPPIITIIERPPE